jgi:hypothetical protein
LLLLFSILAACGEI